MAVKKATSAAKKGARPKRAVLTKAAPAKASATKPTAAKTAAKTSSTKVTKASATNARAAKVTATGIAAKASERPRSRGASVSTGAGALPQRLRVRENERPWTPKELATVRAELEADIVRLQKEISLAEVDLAGLMRDVGDGAGDDPADAGTATFEREQEISLANNAREVFEQSGRALARLVDGSYGICESCGSPVGKNRLLAFPRATLCLTCKSKQERR
jgi:RNA polymerase-binding transcription factor DksA